MGSQVLSQEEQFKEVMLDTYRQAARKGYRATYFLQMIGELGAVETAKQLVMNPTYSSGFAQLLAMGELRISVEAIILRDEFRSMFEEKYLAAAHKKLDEAGYFGKGGK